MLDLAQKSISLRFKELRKKTKLSQDEFALTLGTNRSVIAKIETASASISFEILQKVLSIHNINPSWLYLGIGGMFIENDIEYREDFPEPNVYLYNIEALAGFGIANFQPEEIQERWHIPNLIGKHIALSVQGNSMSPTINEGDKIVAKEVFQNDLRDGYIYIIVSRDSALRVKRLRLYDNAPMLWSDNVLYTPRSEKLEIEKVIKLYHVVMVCRPI